MLLQGDADLRIHVLQTWTIVPDHTGIPAQFGAWTDSVYQAFFLHLRTWGRGYTMPCVSSWPFCTVLIGASLSKPHTCQTASRDLSIYRTSFHKWPRILIHWTASILQCVIQFRKCHHVQIIKTAPILHMQWAYLTTNGCTFNSQHDTAWS